MTNIKDRFMPAQKTGSYMLAKAASGVMLKFRFM